LVDQPHPPNPPNDLPPEETSFIRKYLEGDSIVFDEVDRWARGVLQQRYPRLADEHEDLSQIVHQNLLGNLRAGKYEGRSALRRYVTGITHYIAIERLRDLYRTRALSESLSREPTRTSDNPYVTIEALDRKKLLHQVFQSLPEECRQLWSLIFGERMSHEDVALRLKIAPGTVKSRTWHCRRKARAILRRMRTMANIGPRRQRRASSR